GRILLPDRRSRNRDAQLLAQDRTRDARLEPRVAVAVLDLDLIGLEADRAAPVRAATLRDQVDHARLRLPVLRAVTAQQHVHLFQGVRLEGDLALGADGEVADQHAVQVDRRFARPAAANHLA